MNAKAPGALLPIQGRQGRRFELRGARGGGVAGQGDGGRCMDDCTAACAYLPQLQSVAQLRCTAVIRYVAAFNAAAVGDLLAPFSWHVQGMRVIGELVPEPVAAKLWLEVWLGRVQADLKTTVRMFEWLARAHA